MSKHGIGCHRTKQELIKENEILRKQLEEARGVLDEKDTLGEEMNNYHRAIAITKQKQVQRALEESEERYRKLFELLPDAVLIQREDKIMLCNRAAAKLAGVENPADLVGKSINDFLSADYRQSTSKKINDMLQRSMGAPLEEEKIIRRDGTIVEIETTGTTFEYKGNTNILAIIRDITERKKVSRLEKDILESQRKLDEAIERDKLRTEFFGNISHEFKTPLNVILGAIQLLELYKGEISEYQFEKKLKVMKQNCYRLLRLVNNLIDITKFDCGFMELNLKKYDIVKLLNAVVQSVSGYAWNKRLHIYFYSQVKEKVIAIDIDMIERILLNLLSNGIKFSRPNGVIHVNLTCVDSHIVISVKDFGAGIPKDKLHLVFERFSQLDRFLTRHHEGSGIGLSIVKCLVKLHKGTISVKSELGKGSEFIVKLPLHLESEKEDSIIERIDIYSKPIERANIEFSDIYF